MAFSGKLVEPTKLEKITLRQAAISFNKGKKNAKIKTKRKEIVYQENQEERLLWLQTGKNCSSH